MAWPGLTAVLALVGNSSSDSPLLFFPGGNSSEGESNTSTTGGDPTPGTTLEGLEIRSANLKIPQGVSAKLNVYAIYSDSRSIDVTETADWKSLDSERFEILGEKGKVRAKPNAVKGKAIIQANYEGKEALLELEVDEAILESIEFSPSSISIPGNTTRDFQITAIFSNGNIDITRSESGDGLNLSNSDPTKIDLQTNAINVSGTWKRRIQGLAIGSATITASFESNGTVKTATLPVTVQSGSLESITISPNNPTGLVQGDFRQFTLTAQYSLGDPVDVTTNAIWTSADDSILTFDSTPGRVRSVSPGGPITLTASFGGLTATVDMQARSCTLNSIAISTNPEGSSTTLSSAGNTIQFKAIGNYDEGSCPSQDITETVNWNSSSTAIATISNGDPNRGQSTAVSAGTTNITATHNSITSNTIALTVSNAVLQSLSVTPKASSISVNQTIQFSSTGTYNYGPTQDITTNSSCNWSTSDTSKATISNAVGTKGILATFGAGEVTVTQNCGGISNSTTLTITTATLLSIVVTPINSSIPVGFNQQFTSVGIYSDNSTRILTADSTCSWISSDTGKANISNSPGSRGIATPVSAGSTTITHSCNGGAITGTTNLTVTSATLLGIAVTPVNPTIANGTFQQFTALGTFSDSTTMDLTDQVTWVSATPGTATISNSSGTHGRASAISPGTSVITATFGAQSTSTTLTVTNATLNSITIAPGGTTVAIGFGTTQAFTATGSFSDGSTQNITNQVTWNSSNNAIATIGNTTGSQGIATSVSAGLTNIQASFGAINSNLSQLDVRMITLVAINITPANTTVDSGGSRQVFATGVYNDGTQQDLTTQVTWTTGNSSIAIVSNTPGTMGNVSGTGINGQTTTISATRAGVTGSTNINVISDVVSPTLMSANIQAGNIIRVDFSEPVQISNATNPSNYKLSNTALLSGECSDNSNFTTSPASTVGINSVSVLSPSSYLLQLNGGTSSISYTVTIDKPGIRDIAGNTMGCSNTASFVGEDTIPPTVSSVTSVTPTTVRVTFTEPVNETQARTVGNYKIVNSPTTGSCNPSGSNFTDSTQTSDFTIQSISGSGNVYDITLSSTQTAGTSYVLLANRSGINDVATTPNALGCPNNANFTGNEQLKLNSASCVDRSHIIATFSKPVRSGMNAEGSAVCSNPTECGIRYHLTGVSNLGNIERAELLDGTNCGGAPSNDSAVCITHSDLQIGGVYSLIVANHIDGDGFNNTGCGWASDCSIISATGGETIQTAPNDKRSFTGCYQAPQFVSDGPISNDPFDDSSYFGYVMSYGGKIYVGPNSKGNSASRFNPDGSNPEVLNFTFTKDSTGHSSQSNTDSGRHLNSASSRDGGISVPPFVSIGHSGCTSNSADIATGCGPDNENGRGTFVSGTMNGQEYLFIAGSRPTDNDYIYFTNDLDTTLDFGYLDFQRSFLSVVGNAGSESIEIYGNRLYFTMPGNGTWRPYLMKAESLTPDQVEGVDSRLLRLDRMSGFGYSGTPYNRADIVGGRLAGYKNRIYLANSGAITNSSSTCNLNTVYNESSPNDCQQLGGIIRSTNDNPGICTGNNNCPNFVDITPTSTKFRQFFSIVITKLSDLIPSETPYPSFAEFNNNLYMIRNACRSSRWNFSCTGYACSDDQPCPSGQEIPQLWKCIPTGGGGTECNAGDWNLVAEYGSTGKTNMGVDDNSKLSILIANGSRLYLGFDNPNGSRLYRTKTGVTNPTTSSDFELVGDPGFGDELNNREFYSATSLPQDGVNYLYITTGRSSGLPAQPLRVYRHMNE